MTQFGFIYKEPSQKLIQLLEGELPYSLPLLRRLQFSGFKDEGSDTARTVLISDTDFLDESKAPQRFTAAWVDVGGGKDTQMWLYSTLENPRNAKDTEAAEICAEQLRVLVDNLVRIGKEYGGQLPYPGSVLLGTIHSSVREVLMKTGRVTPRATGLYDKWLFKVENIPNKGDDLPDGMSWAKANVADCEVVISRTDIPRTV